MLRLAYQDTFAIVTQALMMMDYHDWKSQQRALEAVLPALENFRTD